MEEGSIKITFESEFGKRTVELGPETTTDTMIQVFAGLLVSEGYFIGSIVDSMERYSTEYPFLVRDNNKEEFDV